MRVQLKRVQLKRVQHSLLGSSNIFTSIALARNFSVSRFFLLTVILLAFVFSVVAGALFFGVKAVNAQSPIIYYIDCSAGNDTNSGTSTSKAWKSITKANQAPLRPGDQLLFKRGCAWQGPLKAGWNGTEAQPILIGAYGSGNLPIIQDSYSSNVAITGSYQIIEYIETLLSTPPNPAATCNNQPVGWKLGFAFGTDASYNIVRHSKASKLAVGFYFGGNNHHNKMLYNTVVDNNVVWELTANGTQGPAGVVLYGAHNEIGHNYFENNTRICSFNGMTGGISIELYGARNSNIHHNRSFNDRVFVELGSSSSSTAADNTFAYNLHVVRETSSTMGPRFIVTRGQGHSFGPVWRTKAFNNTVYHTGSGSKGITCERCASEVLTVKNNILWVDRQPISSDGPFIEENNTLWSSEGNPLLGFTKSLSTQVVNPGFTNAGANDFRLVAGSPARDAGSSASLTAGYVVDLDAVSVPQSGAVDAGAYEAIGSSDSSPAPSPTPTPSPTPSPTPAPVAACTISINGGAIYTGAPAVQVKANVENAAQVMVATDAGFTGATWQPYQAEFSWTLPDTGGRIATLLVYARFADVNGAPLCGSQLSDDIIFDPVAPTVAVNVETVATSAEGDANASGSTVVNLLILAADQVNGSGVAGMQISLDGTFSDPSWQPYSESVVIEAKGSQMLYVRVMDGSGNISEVATVEIPGQATPANGLYLPQITR